MPGDIDNDKSWLVRYGLVTEQKKGSYKYFVDLGDRMEVSASRTVYVDEVHKDTNVWGGVNETLTGPSS